MKNWSSGPRQNRIDLGKPMGECGSTRKPGHCSFLPERDNLLQKDDWEGSVVLPRQVGKGHAHNSVSPPHPF